ncbi:hypothetical protein HYPSUDRAFT_220272 [Hypholoma sublateritium FD-334 SS-4]|uniref:Uncharacterized protein n=1 Tax=Hypholoma sublateritium (strain FD-334 SS-4) TaxID=945553 RepID=A0A0D2KJS4_HYPSF|nr:hypothetical protein HYPSUDRAFT_220272 [Hypholoma sublateritium FD-334 SS-4]
MLSATRVPYFPGQAPASTVARPRAALPSTQHRLEKTAHPCFYPARPRATTSVLVHALPAPETHNKPLLPIHLPVVVVSPQAASLARSSLCRATPTPPTRPRATPPLPASCLCPHQLDPVRAADALYTPFAPSVLPATLQYPCAARGASPNSRAPLLLYSPRQRLLDVAKVDQG